jgi:hypothetical protein
MNKLSLFILLGALSTSTPQLITAQTPSKENSVNLVPSDDEINNTLISLRKDIGLAYIGTIQLGSNGSYNYTAFINKEAFSKNLKTLNEWLDKGYINPYNEQFKEFKKFLTSPSYKDRISANLELTSDLNDVFEHVYDKTAKLTPIQRPTAITDMLKNQSKPTPNNSISVPEFKKP